MKDIIKDALVGAALAPVQHERMALLDEKNAGLTEKNAALEDENQRLRAQVARMETELQSLRVAGRASASPEFEEDTLQLLLKLFDRASSFLEIAAQTPGGSSMVQYHLDCLEEHALASCGSINMITGDSSWGLTPNGRRLAAELKRHRAA